MFAAGGVGPDSANTAYLWIFVIVGIFTLLGTGGLIGLVKWTKGQGARDARIDATTSAVLGDDDHKGLVTQFGEFSAQLAAIENQLTPNGGRSLTHIGDVARRTEMKVDKLGSKLDEHIGQSTEIHREFRRRVDALERKS